MYGYQSSDVRDCLSHKATDKRNTSLLFIGDSQARDLFTSMVAFVKPDYVVPEDTKSAALTDNILGVDFEYRSAKSINELRLEYKVLTERSNFAPNLVVHGMGWQNERKLDGGLDEESMEANWTLALPTIEKACQNTLCLWMLLETQTKATSAELGSLHLSKEETLYNNLSKKFLDRAHVTFWMSALKIANFKASDHSKAVYLKSQLLWNWHCNRDLHSKLHTCFTGGNEKKSLFTFLTPVVVILFIIYECVSVYIRRCWLGNTTDSDQAKKMGHKLELLGSIIKLGLIMAYFHLCDREDVDWIIKEVKQYSHLRFFISLSLVALAGFLTLKKSDDVSLLHRQQTEEWKGWMQLVILVYHFTGASKVLPIYFVVRLLVTSYLFLNGYGQFTFFFLKGDFGVKRVLQTFIRLNLLVLLLCVVMNRAYQFYYFVPLVSFWFVVIYTTMAMYPKITTSLIESKQNQGYWYAGMGSKLVVLTIVITLLYVCKTGFDCLFSIPVLARMFVLDDSVHEWRFRWQLDRYSVVCGMFCALAYQYMKRNHLIQESADKPLFSVRFTRLIIAMALAVMAAYPAFALLCPDKYRCNEIYPYFGYLPVLSFVLLRNTHPTIRSSYSTLFAWFGKISLELFISQYHIWLADDTHKILVFIPGHPVLNVLTTTLIFVAVCCEIQTATAHFASYFIQRKVTKPPLLPKS
ncbi:N-acetylneuraminate 9-O-acetyltransferase-like isoform X2 [Liolophura sinensis]